MEVDRASEVDVILERLIAVQELRAETRRLKSKDQDVSASDVTIPAGWLHLLSQGLEMAIEDLEENRADGNLGSEEAEQLLERVRGLARAVRDVEPGSAYSVSLVHHEGLWAGLYGAFCIQSFEAAKVRDHSDPPGPRFIESEWLGALYEFMMALEDLAEEAS